MAKRMTDTELLVKATIAAASRDSAIGRLLPVDVHGDLAKAVAEELAARDEDDWQREPLMAAAAARRPRP